MDTQSHATTAAEIIGSAPQGPSPVEQAQAELAKFRTGQNSDLRTRFLAGDVTARAEVAVLHERAFPASLDNQDTFPPAEHAALNRPAALEAQAPQAAANDPAEPDGQAWAEPPRDPEGSAYPIFELRFDESTSPDIMLEGQHLAAATAANLGLEAHTAKGAVSTIETAIARRGGRTMDGVEMAKLEHTLQTRWGAEYNQKMDAVEAAMKKAGGRGGAWLRQSLMAAGPETAAWAFESLANRGGR
jgi:hypothetical protein